MYTFLYFGQCLIKTCEFYVFIIVDKVFLLHFGALEEAFVDVCQVFLSLSLVFSYEDLQYQFCPQMLLFCLLFSAHIFFNVLF